MNITIKSFDTLTKEDLYESLRLRAEVFVVEQDCVYQDVDGKDHKALHVLGVKDGKLVAYTRLFDAGDYFELPSIGRVVVAKDQRSFGYGHDIMNASIEAIESRFSIKDIHISAQEYLKQFYEAHGFQQTGGPYLEDGIPHIGMIRKSLK